MIHTTGNVRREKQSREREAADFVGNDNFCDATYDIPITVSLELPL